MHVLFRESHGLEESATPRDLGQTPAELVVLSFSDSDLGAFAAGWRRGRAGLPGLRLANLAWLAHPLSVDTYVERTLGGGTPGKAGQGDGTAETGAPHSGAQTGVRGILVRLIGGAGWWAYGLEQLSALARRRGIALAVLPADGRPDPALDAASTLPVATLRRLTALCDAGGEIAAQGALAQLALAAGLYAGPVPGPKTLPPRGFWHPDTGPLANWPEDASPALPGGATRHAMTAAEVGGPPGVGAPAPTGSARPLVLIPFYRSWAAAADTEAIAALVRGFEEAGFAACGLFVPSLKDPQSARWLRDILPRLAPAAIVNATAFSAREDGQPGEDGQPADRGAPLDAAGVPVFQVIHATSGHAEWAGAARGLSPADLAMHVALPEVDGRIGLGVISFKEPAAFDPDLQCALSRHRPDAGRVRAAVARVAAWHRLKERPAAQKRVALVLSTYPGQAHRMAHAVGLDALASAEAMLEDLAGAGFDTGGAPATARNTTRCAPGAALQDALTTGRLFWPLSAYQAALAGLPQSLRDALHAAHGAPGDDPACVLAPETPAKTLAETLAGDTPVAGGPGFRFRAIRCGHVLVALQPERSPRDPDREASYHDLSRLPGHGYVAFYLWLRQAAGIDALVHIGAHGTLEWLPGKAVALSADCWPEALAAPLPVLYPFIVNDPGEAAQARRRLGALTLGHLPPPLASAAVPAALVRLERLLDEYSTADGLDPARRNRLIAAIRLEAQLAGVEEDLGLPAHASPAEAITRIDRFVCDLKESQYGDGLHVWGRGTPDGAGGYTGDTASVGAERAALISALAGGRIAPGPSGSPFRGRADVLPTGRNLHGTDPRAVPSRAAQAQGVKLAEELLRRHLQDHGDWPRGLVVNLWGSATMRTAGEDFAMALHLAGLAPRWDAQSDRVTGYEVLPLALLDRPRIEVSLRVSGLFRDTFPGLSQLFEAATAALALRDEAPDMNPYREAAPGPRVFAPAPGLYGVNIAPATLPEAFSRAARHAAGEAWLAASSHDARGAPARAALEQRLRGVDAFVHSQDLPETDLLLAEDYAAHEAGFAAAMARLGAPAPALYHLDATRPDAPRARLLTEEIARVTRARAANPGWLAAMRRHGFRGAAEIAATLDHLAAFAHLAGVVPAHLFDLYHAATLGDADLRAFLARENPQALAAMEARFAALSEAGLWQSRSNSRAAGLS